MYTVVGGKVVRLDGLVLRHHRRRGGDGGAVRLGPRGVAFYGGRREEAERLGRDFHA